MAPESSPSPSTRPVSQRKAARAAKPIYWSNLARIRFWQFTLFGSFIIIIIPALLLPVWVVILPLYIIIFLLLSRFWLSQQMACHACGRILAATKKTGAVKICGRCGTPTDEGLAVGGTA